MKKSIRKIGLVCLGIASLPLVGCFHIPDEDWLPNKDKVETGDIEKEDEIEQAIYSLMDGIDMISSERDNVKTNELNPEELEGTENVDEKVDDIDVEDEMLDDEDTGFYLEEMLNSME